MAKFPVIKPFRDGQDNKHPYGQKGFYPREGLEPTEERISKLAELGYIRDDRQAETEEVETTEETENADEVAEVNEIEEPETTENESPEAEEKVEFDKSNTNDELRAELDKRGVKYSANDSKKELLALLDDSNDSE